MSQEATKKGHVTGLGSVLVDVQSHQCGNQASRELPGLQDLLTSPELCQASLAIGICIDMGLNLLIQI